MQVGGKLNNTYHQNLYIRSAANSATQAPEPNMSTSRSVGGNITSTLLSLSLANALWGLLDATEITADVRTDPVSTAGSEEASPQIQRVRALYQQYNNLNE